MPGRLLVAEDSRTQREVLRARLHDAGFDVVVAADGRQALERLRHGGFDMLISDVVMPFMDGYELCRLTKDYDRRLPVVLLTSMTDPLDVVRGLQAGADGFLRKPYDFSALQDRIETMLRNKSLRDAAATTDDPELFFLEERFVITAERRQILDLLVSTFEDLVGTNQQLRQREVDLAAARDELRAQLTEAQAQRDRLSTVLASVPQVMVVVDAEGLIRAASDALCALVGVQSAADMEGRRISDVLRLKRHNGQDILADERPLSLTLCTGEPHDLGRAFDVLAHRGDGRTVPVLLQSAPVRDPDGRTTGAVGIVHELEALNLHDPLTHLPGHAAFARHVHDAVELLAGAQEIIAVVVLVLDRSSELTDSLGRERKDQLVADLSGRLHEALHLPAVRQRTHDAAAGYLGDGEFALVLPGLRSEAQGVLVADSVRAHMGGRYRIGDLDLDVALTAGLSLTTQAGSRAQELVPAAAAAAHLAAREGGNRVVSSFPGAVEAAADRLRQEADLRRGIEDGELRVHYQPIMSFGGGVDGVEALVRWQHPTRGFQSPGDFIPLAEESGLVVPLGWAVLRQSCAQLARWRENLPGAGHLTVSVNLSPRQLMQPDVVAQVEAALADSGLPAIGLTLEVTEAGVVSESQEAVAQLRRLRATGVRVAVDDFGTGYSSLLQLRRLPVDSLKIDRQFVDGLMTDPDDAAIVSASISLAQALRLRVVAEGVETVEQAEELRRLGCDCGQGFLWSRPLAPGEFERAWAVDVGRWAASTPQSV